MKRHSGFTLIEALVVAGIAILLAAMLLPALRQAAGENDKRDCAYNLALIVKACIYYQEPNGEFFPAHSQYNTGTKDDFKPMSSLANLYPVYIDNPRIFGCPATTDKPFISSRVRNGHWYACFGTDALDLKQPATDPVLWSAISVSTDQKCSYFYDELSHFRDVGPGQAIAADADGFNFSQANGEPPKYPVNWTRAPRKPNHADGQNVMYFDGNVRWSSTPYASDDPADNIFCPNANLDGKPWNPDVDAYLWDGVNKRTVEKH